MRNRPLLRRHVLLVTALAATAVALSACGEGSPTVAASEPPTASTPAAAPTGVLVEGAWVRATTGSRTPSMTGAFLTLRNTGSADVALVRAATPLARMAQLHEMTMVAGKAAMHEVAGGIVVPAGGTRVLEPGGYHVMLMKLLQPLAAGDEVVLTLTFSDGTTRTVTAPVKAFAEETGGYSPTPSAMP